MSDKALANAARMLSESHAEKVTLRQELADARAEIARLRQVEADAKMPLEEIEGLREAIRVLAREVFVYRGHVGACNAVDKRGGIVLSRLHKGTMHSNIWGDAIRAVYHNPVAAAAVEEARNAKGGNP